MGCWVHYSDASESAQGYSGASRPGLLSNGRTTRFPVTNRVVRRANPGLSVIRYEVRKSRPLQRMTPPATNEGTEGSGRRAVACCGSGPFLRRRGMQAEPPRLVVLPRAEPDAGWSADGPQHPMLPGHADGYRGLQGISGNWTPVLRSIRSHVWMSRTPIDAVAAEASNAAVDALGTEPRRWASDPAPWFDERYPALLSCIRSSAGSLGPCDARVLSAPAWPSVGSRAANPMPLRSRRDGRRARRPGRRRRQRVGPGRRLVSDRGLPRR